MDNSYETRPNAKYRASGARRPSRETKQERRRQRRKQENWWNKTKRRAKGRVVIGYTYSMLQARLSMFPRCWICDQPFTEEEPATKDHVKPLDKGGYECLANFRPAHGRCNNDKRASWGGVADVHYIKKHRAVVPHRKASSFKQYWLLGIVPRDEVKEEA